MEAVYEWDYADSTSPGLNEARNEAAYDNIFTLNDNLGIINLNMHTQHQEVRTTLETQHVAMMDLLSSQHTEIGMQLTEQHNSIGNQLTEQHTSIGEQLTEQHNSVGEQLTEQHNSIGVSSRAISIIVTSPISFCTQLFYLAHPSISGATDEPTRCPSREYFGSCRSPRRKFEQF